MGNNGGILSFCSQKTITKLNFRNKRRVRFFKIRTIRKVGLTIIISLIINQLSTGQNQSIFSTLQRYELGEVEITQKEYVPPLSIDDLEFLPSDDPSTSISRNTGISFIQYGNRAESSIAIRGIDIRGVPVYIDGIPVYAPYDGYLDLSNLIAGNQFSVDLSKGYTPGGLSVNSLGGAINFISHTPTRLLEFDGEIGSGSGNSSVKSVSLGSRFGKVYFYGSVKKLQRDFYYLSADFDTTGRFGNEEDYIRDNSYFDKFQSSIKIGFKPNTLDEYSLNYVYHSSEKGSPPYAGFDSNQLVRYWQWPLWKKNSLYFIGKKRLSAASILKFRLFYDDFNNQLSSYDDDQYNSQTRGYAFNSYYDDHSIGTNADYIVSLHPNNLLKINAQIKSDNHVEHNENEPPREFQDVTYYLGIENMINLGNSFSMVGSAGYTYRSVLNAEDYNSSDSLITSMETNNIGGMNYQGKLIYDIAKNHKLSAGLYRKIRLATMKERYSYRAGLGIPNPYLTPEKSIQGELSYESKIGRNIELKSALFYQKLTDAIVTKYDTVTDLIQAVNKENAIIYGMEFQLNYEVGRWLEMNFQYTLQKMDYDKEVTDIYFTHIPENEVRGSVKIMPFNKLSLITEMLYVSERYSTSYGSIAPEFFITNIKISYYVTRKIELNMGLNNIFDKNYAYIEGYPEPGRNFMGVIKFSF